MFKFQPGHRKRIKKFVDEVKQLVSTCAKKRQSTRTKRRRNAIEPSVKYIKMSDDTSVNENTLSLNSCIATDKRKECFSELDLLTDFCQSFAKWQRQQKNQEYTEKSKKTRIFC